MKNSSPDVLLVFVTKSCIRLEVQGIRLRSPQVYSLQYIEDFEEV